MHKKGGIIRLRCDRFGLRRSPLAYGRLKLIATALYRHGTLTPRRFIATAFIATAFIATAFIATAFIATAFIATAFYRHGLYRHGLYRHGVLSPRRCARRAHLRYPVIIRPE